MRLGHVLQLVGLVDHDLDDALGDDIENSTRGRFQIGPLFDVGEQRRPRGKKRALLPENAQIERRDRARRLAETDEGA